MAFAAALMMAVCLCMTAISADEMPPAGNGVAAGSPTPDPQATTAPTLSPPPSPTNVPTPSSGATAAPEASSNPIPDPTQGPFTGQGVYVVAATVTDAAGGEVTTVKWNDTVNIVLKVLDHSTARLNVKPEDIAARINSSIFQYTGTGEIGQLVDGTDDYGPYYSYILLFRDVKYVGGGNTLPIDLSYLDATLPMQQFSVTLGQCVDKDPNDPSKIKSPTLVLRESSYGNTDVTAGNPFNLSMTVYATSGTEAINDVVVSVTLPEHITLTGGSLSSYIGTIPAKGTKQVSFNILPSAGITASVSNIVVNMTGIGAVTGTAVTGTSTISVPVIQPDRFELQNLEIPESMMLGESATVSLTFVNKGKNAISNLEATISGSNLGVEGTKQYVGNVAAGSENSVDFDLMPTEAGPVTGVITLSYEGSDGKINNLTKDFVSTAEEAMTMDPGMDPNMPVEEPQQGIPVWGWVLIVLGVAAVVIIVVVVVIKKRKAAAINKLEDSDEDL